MTPLVRNLSTLGTVLSILLISACAPLEQKAAPPAAAASKVKPTASAPSASHPLPSPAVTPPPSAQQALTEGMDLYDKGDFNGAIKKLGGSADIWAADKSLQLSALKTMAFSYCVSSRQTLCRQQFEKALKLDPGFDLEPGEKQHPLWAPVFEQAKKRVAAAASKPAGKAAKPASGSDAVKK
ncbi:MAG: TssQ family T6SS-associated lipoprotein [Pseudomonadota bacterium]